ncbi:MAG: acyltransferase [Oscillospiraceae bacterium]|nr:acyltransferase [Oscillospiraceae bacterium]
MIRWLNAGRVLGLLLVLGYHFFQDFLPGGFFGVDVFFTFSGYLITALAVEEYRKSGNFRLGSFCKRRFLRIWPPLVLMAALTLPFALLISPDFTADIGRQLASALGGVTNWFEILNGGSYEARMLPHLFLHTWSLAAEIQFYIIWGLFCAAAVFLLRKLTPEVTRRSYAVLKGLLFVVSIALAVVSYLRMRAGYAANAADPSAVYFGLDTRGFPFMLGAAAGALYGVRIKERAGSAGAKFFAACGMILPAAGLFILSLSLRFSDESTYRTGILGASLLTILIILSARRLHAVTAGTDEPRALTVTSDLSYGIFLFHWPLYVVFARGLGWKAWPAAAVTLALSALFAALMHYGIEPLLHTKPGEKRRRLAPVPAALLIAAMVLSGFALNRAPVRSSLEEEMLAGYLYQDAAAIGSAEKLVGAVKDEPLVIPASMPVIGDLIQGLPVSSGGGSFQPVPPVPPPVIRPPGEDDQTGIPAGVTIIGDSVALGARKRLAESIPHSDVDTEGNRSIALGYELVMEWQQAGTLREYVVVGCGTNGTADVFEKIDLLIANLAPGHRLILITPFDGRASEKWLSYRTMVYCREIADQYPFVTIADWAAVIKPREELLGADQIHIGGNAEAIQLYVNCVIEAINEASGKPAKE